MDKSIFVIDDQEISLKIAGFILKRHGSFNTIATYSEANVALEYIVSNRNNGLALPDVIFLDLNMPIMDGWNFLDKYKEFSTCMAKDIDIYILSSSTDAREIKRAEQYPFVKGFFSKPLSPEMLSILANTLISA